MATVSCKFPHHPEGLGPGRAPATPEQVAARKNDMETHARWEAIRTSIRKHLPEVHACYDARMVIPPYPQGRVVTRLFVKSDGHVEWSCVAESTVTDPQIDRCIVDAELDWTFQSNEFGALVIVDYPFVLTPP